MKLGILTQPLGHNYGGILQNYALQKFLQKNGHEVSTINLRGLQRKSSVKNRIKGQITIGVKKLAKLHIPNDKFYSSLHNFIQKEISLTDRYDAPLNRSSLLEHSYDGFIVGSDQVWRPSYSPNILNYFLDFCSGKDVRRITYAASFGNSESEFSNKEILECRRLLAEFDGVSVREETGINSCKELFGIDSHLVCDPTLLLAAEDYRFKESQFSETSICAFYLLSPNPEKIRFIFNYCKKNDLLPLSLTPLSINDSNVFAPTSMLSVPEWLGFLSRSSSVITDSFHGTVFSVLFKKPFLTFDNPSRGSDRISGFLNLAKLQDHLLLTNANNGGGDNIIPTINWDIVDKSLQPLICSSKDFLINHLKSK